MHEQSETIQGRDGRWYNIYGQGTGAPQPMPLPRAFGFEQNSYSTPIEASNKAAWRSVMGEGQYPMQGPQYGVSNSYQPSPQAQALGKVIEVLQDPRNAWMGMGALRGMRLLKPIVPGPEMGGFRETTQAMRRYMGVPRENLRKMDIPNTESTVRAGYLDDVSSDNAIAQNLLFHNKQTSPAFVNIDPSAATLIRNNPNLEAVILNQNRLNHLTKVAPFTTYGKEGELPPYLVKKFGFK